MDPISSKQIEPISYHSSEFLKTSSEQTTLKKVMIVASITLAVSILMVIPAYLLELNIVIWTGVGITVGIITGLMTLYFSKDTVKSLPSDSNAVPPLQQLSLKQEENLQDVAQSQHLILKQEENIQDVAQFLEEHFKQNLENPKLTDEKLDQLLRLLDQTHLHLILQDVYDKLVEKVGKEKAQEAFQVAGLMKKNLPQTQKEFECLLQTIQTQAGQDLFLDDQTIEEKFGISNCLRSFSTEEQKIRREELQQIINHAYLNREFKQKTKLINGDTEERNLLAALKFKVGAQSGYQNKDFVYELLQEIIPLQLQTDLYKGPLSVIKQTLKNCALQSRLKAAGLHTSLQIEKFQFLTSFFQTSKETLNQLKQGINISWPASFTLDHSSLAVRSLQEFIQSDATYYINHVFPKFLGNKKIRNKFRDENITLDHFQQFIKNNKDKFNPQEFLAKYQHDLLNPQDGILAPRIAFYTQWSSHLKAEMIQGFEDKNEILGEGVCWSVCQRIRLKAHLNPDITPEQLASEIKILANDRYQQVAYSIKFRLPNLDKEEIPAFIKNEKLVFSSLFATLYDGTESTLTRYFDQYQDRLKDSAGWAKLALIIEDKEKPHSHAILVRQDHVRNCFWIVDPNIGFLCFEGGNQSPKEAREACFACLKDIIATFYPLTYYIKGDQLLPKIL